VTMNTFITRSTKDNKKAAEYFIKMHSELELDKYKLPKYQELFQLASFQAMHDADLAYCFIYEKCAEYANCKEDVLNYLKQQEMFSLKHPKAFNQAIFRRHTLIAISEVKEHLESGKLDYLYY
jgi:hypothetical protein